MRRKSPQIVYFLLKLITNDKQIIVHGKVDHNISVMKNEIVCIQYVSNVI